MVKTILTMVFLSVAWRAQAGLSVSQTFSPGATTTNQNPGVAENSRAPKLAPAGMPAVGIMVGLNIYGGYDGNLYAFLVAPNGTLMNQPGVGVDGFGAKSSEMFVTVSATGGTSIQSQRGGFATSLGGTYQVGIFFSDLAAGGDGATLSVLNVAP